MANAEFQILDRRTFGRFLGIDEGDRVPDETTIWRFREALMLAGATERLFARFDEYLKAAGYLAMGGQIVDASLKAALRQRMTDAERETVRDGGIPEEWKAKPAKLAQKGEPWVAIGSRPMANDARWTLRRGRRKRRPDGTLMAEIATPVFGYKSHIGIDRRRGFIRKWSVTDAARHDGRELAGLLDRANTGASVWADTAYRSGKNERRIAAAGLVSKIHFRRPPGRSMPERRARANAARARERAAIEHVFAEQKARMGLFVRTIGLARAKAKIGLANLAYNLKRFTFWQRSSAAA